VGLKFRFGFDDALDVVGVHLVGGVVGTVLIGFLATDKEGGFLPDGAERGLLYGGGLTQLATQVVVAAIAIVFSFVLTFVIGSIIKAITGLRVADADEVGGVDFALHGETAYDTTPATGGRVKEGISA
jgi:Amt family ammonium transporter